MHPIRPSQAQPVNQAARGNQAARETQANPVQHIPTTDFLSHFVIADSDSLFRAVHMELTNQPGVQASNQQVMELRQAAANYLTEHKQALIAHPSFDGEAGVDKLDGLLTTQGQWNQNAGDLVAPILAQVLGREVRILEPAQQGGFYEVNDNRIFRPQDPALPAGKPDTGQPPIYLLQTGDGRHYQYLESRSSHTNTTSETNVISEAVRQPITPREDMHKHFGIDDLEMISQEPWSNDDWGKSVFMQLNDVNKPMCMHKDLLKHSFEDTKFGNAIGGNAEGHNSRLGEERYIKLTTGNTNIYLSTNKESQKATNRLKHHVSNPDNTSAAVLSLEFVHKARIARVSYNPSGVEQRDVAIDSSIAHGQSEYSVYKLAGHRQKSLNEAEQLARDGKRLFSESGFDQSLNPPTSNVPPASKKIARMPRQRRHTPASARAMFDRPRNSPVETPSDLARIANAFAQTARGRSFNELTPVEQTAAVRRVAKVTGYLPTGPTGVRAALASMDSGTTGARQQPRASMNNARALEHNSSPARAMLGRRRNNPVRTAADRTQIRNAFNQANERPFSALTQEEQTAEVRRISRETGFLPTGPTGVRAALASEGNSPTNAPRQNR